MQKGQILVLAAILLAVILIRIPTLFFWNEYLTGDDAAIYMETAKNIAEGKGFVSSINRHISSRDRLESYVMKYGNDEQAIKVAPLYIYALSVLYRIFGGGHFYLVINIFNLNLFLLSLLLFFRFLLRVYPDRSLVACISALYMGFHALLLEFSFGAHMEMMNLLTFVLVLILHKRIIRDARPAILYVLAYAVCLAALFLTKYSSLPFVGAFLLHLMYQKRFRTLLIVVPLLLLFVIPPYYIWDNMFNPRIINGFGRFPFTGYGTGNLPLPAIFYFIHNKWAMLVSIVSGLAGKLGLLMLFPFLLLAMKDLRKYPLVQLSLSLLICIFGFYLYIGFLSLRYLIPAYLIFVPVALNYIFENLKLDIKANKIVLAAFLCVVFFLHVNDVIVLTKSIRKVGITTRNNVESAIKVLEDYQITSSFTVMSDMPGFQLFSKPIAILAPATAMNKNNLHEVIEVYEIDYLLDSPGDKRINTELCSNLLLINDPDLYGGVALYSTGGPQP